MADPLDSAGWFAQTRLREIGEGVAWRLIQWLKQSPNSDSQPGADWGWLASILQWSLRGLGLILAGLGIYLLARFLWRSLGHLPEVTSSKVRKTDPVQSRLDWLSIAQAAQAEQDYQKAFQALYRALLLLLNEAGLLLNDAARTDREAIRRLDRIWSLSDQPIAVRDDWVLLFKTHEAVCFNSTDVSQDLFLQCRAAYDQLVPYLQPRSSA
jgi:hypothetical protein